MSQLKVGQSAPDFSTIDAFGKPVRLSNYRGKTVLLSFQRNVGCPVCNLRFHEFQNNQTTLEAQDIAVLAVYESSATSMQQYLQDQQSPYARLIPDPEQRLYKLYGSERSVLKLLNGVLLHGGFGKMSASKKLTPTLQKQDGNADRVGADFLIDSSGVIRQAHYHRYVGDDLPLTTISAL